MDYFANIRNAKQILKRLRYSCIFLKLFFFCDLLIFRLSMRMSVNNNDYFPVCVAECIEQYNMNKQIT